MKLPDQKFRAAKTSARRLEQSLIHANSASVSLWDKVVHVVLTACGTRWSMWWRAFVLSEGRLVFRADETFTK